MSSATDGSTWRSRADAITGEHTAGRKRANATTVKPKGDLSGRKAVTFKDLQAGLNRVQAETEAKIGKLLRNFSLSEAVNTPNKIREVREVASKELKAIKKSVKENKDHLEKAELKSLNKGISRLKEYLELLDLPQLRDMPGRKAVSFTSLKTDLDNVHAEIETQIGELISTGGFYPRNFEAVDPFGNDYSSKIRLIGEVASEKLKVIKKSVEENKGHLEKNELDFLNRGISGLEDILKHYDRQQ